MNSQFAEMCASAQRELALSRSINDRFFNFSNCNWGIDQIKGQITFTNAARGVSTSAPVDIIGSFNKDSHTWLWGWANTSLRESVTSLARELRQMGIELGFTELTQPRQRVTMSVCWAYAALGYVRGKRQGIYAASAGSLIVYAAYGELTITPVVSGSEGVGER